MPRPPTITWIGPAEGHLQILDQRALPTRTDILVLRTPQDAWHAIKTLAVRGAPAIGVAAAYGMVLAAQQVPASGTSADLLEHLDGQGAYLKSSRPTAVNLAWAVDRMLAVAHANRSVGVRSLRGRLLDEAHAIFHEDLAMCSAIGRHGAPFVKPNTGVLTHCNAGNLATSQSDTCGGTALSILYEAHRQKTPFRVFADETRPLLQGARLTAWELTQAGIDTTVICDNMAAVVMREKKVHLVVVGADRIAANGDTANKIGTYTVALLARAHGIPFVVAAPSSTFDLTLATGEGIPIEERPREEITSPFNTTIAPAEAKAYNPAFDVTPAELITAIVTERGVIESPTPEKIRAMMGGSSAGARQAPH